jgi:P27 family predicted phage terminase small subunit
LTQLDRAALAAHCGAYGLWAEATEAIQVRRHGEVAHWLSNAQSPYVAIANRQAEIMMRIASEFGFTPASRSPLSTPLPNEPSLLDLIENDTDRTAEAADDPIRP